jgi:hypothetical protein
LAALSPTEERVQAEEEEVGGVEDPFSCLTRVVLRAVEAQGMVEGVRVPTYTCNDTCIA